MADEYFIYFFVFLASLLVDVVPFIGPPAWTVMVFLPGKIWFKHLACTNHWRYRLSDRPFICTAAIFTASLSII
jgi:hypothetical protein